MSSHTDG